MVLLNRRADRVALALEKDSTGMRAAKGSATFSFLFTVNNMSPETRENGISLEAAAFMRRVRLTPAMKRALAHAAEYK